MKVPDVKTLFGQRIRVLRKTKGWSQEEFAHQVGLDRSYMGGVERGERNLSLENICLIAKALGVPTAELFQGWGTGPDKREPTRKPDPKQTHVQ